jgi:Papain family cysteine protease
VAPPTSEHQPTVAQHMLPSGVDWRGTDADSPVKNQAACGSCWVTVALQKNGCAVLRQTQIVHRVVPGIFDHNTRLCLLQAFGAIGAIETAYYRITGKQKLFSEQNLIDCSWDIYDVSYRYAMLQYVWPHDTSDVTSSCQLICYSYYAGQAHQ